MQVLLASMAGANVSPGRGRMPAQHVAILVLGWDIDLVAKYFNLAFPGINLGLLTVSKKPVCRTGK